MVAANPGEAVHAFKICKVVEIAAPVDIAFEALLEELGPGSEMPGGQPFPMVLEPWPGGRWYRDLGDGAGHYWGRVQVIKPPSLVEICGPMFMSYAATNHVQYRLSPEGAGTRLQLTHSAIGQITAEHREGVHDGWNAALEAICKIAARLMQERQ